MASSREQYQITAVDLSDPNAASAALNFLLARIGERLDQMEGRLGDAKVEGTLRIVDTEGNTLHGMGNLG